MNIKKTINFKELRDKGINALDIYNDEVIQLKGKSQIYCVVTQEYLLNLLADKDSPFSNSLIQGAALNTKFNHNQNIRTNNISSLLGSSFDTKVTIEDRVSKLEKEIEEIKKQGK
jgi:hypothetical protein